ncbi:hypothetical protein M899_2420 [Bacteriovorax sp. BSW11_IV]|uniref:hypothetical protein n=1 Tax=Bacteriovorax sp. BSW11_IV TaxID=1353529 RepID=UPI000389DEF8|nr:hypothetical protein [Bacteriovorax sp. BSW11_IV]EQC44528.1 hypothetical protein M899_2420 [Bacteriovorax sp. BSW11_IV]
MNVIKSLFFILILNGLQSWANVYEECTDKKLADSIIKIQNVLSHSQAQSLDFKTYDYIDFVMDCDYKGHLKQDDKEKVLSILKIIKKEKTTPFVWADSNGVEFWENGVAKLGFLPEEIRVDLPIILSQLNSSVVSFVPSESNERGTNYNFEADLIINLFSPWDRRDCHCLAEKDLEYFNEDISNPRISSEEQSNFTRNYSVVEVSKIAIHKKPICYWYEDTDKIRCDYEFNESIAHEILHLLETRYKRFIYALHNAKGGYKDRLKQAQTVVPAFGVTKCTRDSWEEYCDEHGTISEDETLQIVQKTKAPQDTGMNAGRYYAYELDESSGQLYCEGEIKENNGRKYCINFNLESLYTFVRGGEEYISVLLEKGINDPIQFEKIASAEEKKLFSLLKEYIF